MLRTLSDVPDVCLVMHPRTMLYEAAIAAEVFGGTPDPGSPGPRHHLTVCTVDGRPHPWLPHLPTTSYSAIPRADCVIVPSTDDLEPQGDEALISALREAHAGGARVAALCTGAFLLAEAGLLDGLEATTHWMHAAELARRYPQVDVRADVLYVDHGDVLTSAGKTAALDLCLHLVRRDLGAGAANQVARRLVVPAHRRGGQAQFITPPAPPRSSPGIAPTLEWALARLDQPLTVQDLAHHAGLSSRQLARRMHAEVEAGPLAWLHQQRVARAQELLEHTDVPVEQVAASCGMGTASTLRRHFRGTVGVTPTAYRSSFRSA